VRSMKSTTGKRRKYNLFRLVKYSSWVLFVAQ